MLMKLQVVVLKHKSAQEFILNDVVWCVNIENGEMFQHHVIGVLWFDSEMIDLYRYLDAVKYELFNKIKYL
jgi:hypothetical protein